MYRFVTAAMGRSRAVLTILAALLLGGLSSYITLPREADPDIPIPIVYVGVVLPGISPADAERLLVKPMELELRTLTGLKEMQSISAQNYGAVLLEFDVSFDEDQALLDVREKMDQVRPELPDDAEEPDVREFNAGLFPVIMVNLTSSDSERELYRHAKMLKEEIAGMPNVLEAKLVGQREEVLEVVIDPRAMENYNITADELYSVLARNNRLIPAGSIDSGQGRFSLSVPGLIESEADIRQIPIKSRGDAVVQLSDVAEVRRTFKDQDVYARFNGAPTISIEVVKRLGANIVQTTQQVRDLTNEYTVDWPESIEVDFSSDISDFIFEMIGSLETSISNAIMLVMILVIAALGLRSALLVGLSIPTSFLVGFLIVDLMGMTLNMMIMFGFILSVGILVDGAIVVVEYADRKMAEGVNRREAYAMASSRMFWPILSSTATTLAAFGPMLLWPGVSGKFMSYLPITVIILLSASLATVMLFLPVIGGLFGKSEQEGDELLTSLSGETRINVREMKGMTGRYLRFLKMCMNWPITTLATAIAILTSVVILFGEYNNGVEFSGSIEPHQVNVLVKGRGNLSVEDADLATKLVESIILDIPGVSNAFSQAGPSIGGGDGAPTMGDGRIPADTIGLIRVEFTHFSTRVPASQIVREINQRAERFAGIEVEIKEREQGPPQGKGIEIEVSGQDLGKLTDVTNMMTQYMQSRDDLYIDVENTLPLPGIEWNLSVDREAAGRFQADIVTVGNVIQLVTNGILIGHYRPDDSDEEIEIRARYPYGARSFDRLDQLRVLTPAGNVPITNFVKREPGEKRDAISRIDGQRVIQIQAAMAVNPETGSEYLATDLENDFLQWMETQDFVPSDVKWRLRGANEEAEESAAFLGRAMIASLMLMFIILLMQFNSLYCTMLTLSTVVLSTIGVLLGMILTGQVFSVIMTGTGVVALAGIVVNNSIVLIDTYQRLLATGMDKVDVILKTAGQRLRPILLTTVTTMIGLFPMAIQASINVIERTVQFGEPTAAWWVQLSTAIIFGLGFSTLLTLILVPVMLHLPDYLRDQFGRLRGSSELRDAMRGGDSPAE
ncbi:MAG: Swarming motility protein SwrC [Alphaproteobacteria bacterium]|nr:MAG: Swarming motility protein SwrC [Alphaproteobacteria bacterium]